MNHLNGQKYLNSRSLIPKRWWKHYRIVYRREYEACPYEVQAWRIFWPFWKQCDFVNLHMTVEDAKEWMVKYDQGKAGDYVVEYL